MEPPPRRPDPIALLLFAACVLLGSANFLAARVSNLELPPLWGAGLRFGVAATVFMAIAAAARRPWPRGSALTRTVGFGLLNFGVFFALVYWALLHVTAGSATIVLASVPLLTLFLAVAQRLERFRARALFGGVAALLGIAWLGFAPGALAVPLLPLLAVVAAALAVAQSLILGKRISGAFPPVTNAIGMTCGAVLLLVASLVAGEQWTWPQVAATRWALLYMVLFGSVAQFALILLLIRRWAPSAISYGFVVMPVSTLLLEAWLLGVPITLAALIGAGLVMVGVWFGALAPDGRAGAAVPPRPAPVQPLEPSE